VVLLTTTITGWTTGAANYILIEAASGDEAVKTGVDTARYRLDTVGDALVISENYVRIDGMQISGEDDGINISGIDAGNDIRIENCRIYNGGAGVARGIDGNDNQTNLIVANTILENWVTDGIRMFCTTVGVYNCVVYNCAGDGIEQESGTITVRNSAVFVNGDDFDAVASVDYCASDDGDADTTDVAESGGGANWPSDFTDAANGNFTLLVGSGLVGNGTDNPSGSGYGDPDIEGDSRTSTWDVGADEYVADEPSGMVIHSAYITSHRRLLRTSDWLFMEKIKNFFRKRLWRPLFA
jgi:hypothetical protein